MSNYDFNPGITYFEIKNLNDDGYIVINKSDSNNYIEIKATFTGATLLKGIFDDETKMQYLYIFLVFNSPRDFEIISSIEAKVPKEAYKKERISIAAKLNILNDKIYDSDFVESYYYISIATSDKPIENANDVNFLATSKEHSLLQLKVLTKI